MNRIGLENLREKRRNPRLVKCRHGKKPAANERECERIRGRFEEAVRLTEQAYKYYRYSYGYAATDEEETPVQLPAGD